MSHIGQASCFTRRHRQSQPSYRPHPLAVTDETFVMYNGLNFPTGHVKRRGITSQLDH